MARLPSICPEIWTISAQAKAPFLITMDHIVIVGARDHGLWLSPDDGTTFRKIAGCRNVTACAIGMFSGRIHAWAALFFELDDRAEMVGIDCKTLRVQRLAEYRVVTDSSGPEDDPPERARIDCLMWDAPRQKSWRRAVLDLPALSRRVIHTRLVEACPGRLDGATSILGRARTKAARSWPYWRP